MYDPDYNYQENNYADYLEQDVPELPDNHQEESYINYIEGDE